MPEPASPGLAENAAEHRPEALTPETIETVLADFRTWLQQLAADEVPAAPATPPESIDLHTLLAQFTALRHEVNLQTRAARTQQEQSSEALRQLTTALETLRQTQTATAERERQREEQSTAETVRPLLKVLVDLYDNLSLARRELQRVQDVVVPDLAALAAGDGPGDIPAIPPVPELPRRTTTSPARSPFLGRWFGGPAGPGGEDQHELVLALERALSAQQEVLTAQRQQLQKLAEQRQEAGRSARRVREFLESVITGYTMSLQRLERALQQQGLEPIPAVGQPFDPERMEAMEAVAGSGRPAGEVLEEVRRGYLWHGRVFRYAQVRVARS